MLVYRNAIFIRRSILIDLKQNTEIFCMDLQLLVEQLEYLR